MTYDRRGGGQSGTIASVIVAGTTGAEIQTAIDDLPDLGSGVVRKVIVKGLYTATAAIELPSDILLDLTAARITLGANANCDLITNDDWAAGNSNIHILGGYLDGNRTNQSHVVGDGPGQSCITLVNVSYFSVKDVFGTSPQLHGIDMSTRDIATNPLADPGCLYGVVDGCTFRDFGDDGITGHFSGRITVSNCILYDAAASYSGSSNGIEVDDGDFEWVIDNCIAHDCINGFVVKGHDARIPARRVAFSACLAYHNSGGGWLISQAVPHASTVAEDVTLSGCVAVANERAVIITNYANLHFTGLLAKSNTTNDFLISETSAGKVSKIRIVGGHLTAPTPVAFSGTATAVVVEAVGVNGYADENVVVATINPALATASLVPGATTTLYRRVMQPCRLSSVGIHVGTQNGNISVAVYRNTGVGRAATPGTRLATSGAVACPAAGYSAVSLGATVDLFAGDWIAISTDSATASFRASSTGGVLTSNLAAGLAGHEAVHPCPSAPSITYSVSGPVCLVAVP